MISNVKSFIAAVIALYNYLLDCGLSNISEVTLSSGDDKYTFTDVSLKNNILNFKFNGKDYFVNFSDNEIEFSTVKHVFEEAEKEVEDFFIVKSTVSGRVINVFVNEGDNVKENDLLLKIEAMKMEIDIKSPVNGVVDRIFISKDMEVKLGSPLISIRVYR